MNTGCRCSDSADQSNTTQLPKAYRAVEVTRGDAAIVQTAKCKRLVKEIVSLC